MPNWLQRHWIKITVGFLAFLLIAVEIPALMVIFDNRPVLAEPTWDSPQTAELVQRACADCHSNKTEWPVYSYIPPVSLFVANHVREGREHLNFSEWVAGRDQEDLGEIIEVIRGGEMPMPSYVRMHPAADLTPQEQEQIIAGFRQSLASGSGIPRADAAVEEEVEEKVEEENE